MAEQTHIAHLHGDMQAHFEQEHGHPVTFEFLQFKLIAADKALFDVKISKDGSPIGRYHGITGYRNQHFFITKLCHKDTSPA